MLKNATWTAACTIPIFSQQDNVNQCQCKKESCFALVKIHITKKQSMIRRTPVRLTSLTKGFWRFLDFNKTIFSSIHAWLRNPALHHLPLFQKHLLLTQQKLAQPCIWWNTCKQSNNLPLQINNRIATANTSVSTDL